MSTKPAMVRRKTSESPPRPAATTMASVLPFRYVGLAVAVGVVVVGLLDWDG
jgi:hypothetical protein